MANFQDRDGETNFFDDADASGPSKTLWVDRSGVFLGLGGVAPAPAEDTPVNLMLVMRLMLHGGEEILPFDRRTVWNPGLNPVGGIINRTTVFQTVSPLGGGADDTANIQSVLNVCPLEQVVQLTAGTFKINSSFIGINVPITLRGAGAGVTILQTTDGAVPNVDHPGPTANPIIKVGDALRATDGANIPLTADAVKGSFSVTVADPTGFIVGHIVQLDELSGVAFRTDPVGRGQILASSDYRVIYQKHNPPQGWDDGDPVADSINYGRSDRPTCELKKVVSVVGNVITFSSPIHIDYRVSHTAQLTRFDLDHSRGVGIENLTLDGGDNANIQFGFAAYCWMKNVESKNWLGGGVMIVGCYGLEIRDSYIHDAVWPFPGGAGYAISQRYATSECLYENCIIAKANKVMVSQACGAGTVYGYNYTDMGGINGQKWVEVGINASHFVGPHHTLFEGNYSWNADSDQTHGNSIYNTYFRNHLSGTRKAYVDVSGYSVDDANDLDNGPRRCAGLMAYSYWMSFIGNVLGESGEMSGWVDSLEGFLSGNRGIWMLGWDSFDGAPVDPQVAATCIRDGNWDWLSNSQQWLSGEPRPIPNSLYLSGRPAFFGVNPWPWVDPSTGATHVLPAKARFDAGTPNIVV